jgi:hypothetical protein
MLFGWLSRSVLDPEDSNYIVFEFHLGVLRLGGSMPHFR